MIEHGIADFGLAKRKAAERFGVRSAGALPSNGEIQASLAERQRIFEPATHDERLSTLRRTAARIMEYLAPFRPRLVGSVLAGTPTVNATIELHVFSDSPEVVAALLEKCGFALKDTQRRADHVRPFNRRLLRPCDVRSAAHAESGFNCRAC